MGRVVLTLEDYCVFVLVGKEEEEGEEGEEEEEARGKEDSKWIENKEKGWGMYVK